MFNGTETSIRAGEAAITCAPTPSMKTLNASPLSADATNSIAISPPGSAAAGLILVILTVLLIRNERFMVATQTTVVELCASRFHRAAITIEPIVDEKSSRQHAWPETKSNPPHRKAVSETR